MRTRGDAERRHVAACLAVAYLACALDGCGSSEPAAPAPVPAHAPRGGPFACDEGACTQAYPAYPDDGEWECIDLEGVVACRGGIAPAGVRPGAPDAAFLCGAPLPSDDAGRRVCIDAAPDVPGAPADGWRCRFDRDGRAEARRCERASGRGGIGAACAAGCPRGMRCEEGRCALERPDVAPDCWLDTDCEGGAACVLARCTAS